MSAPRRNQRWIWVGRIMFGIITAGLISYFMIIGLDKADKLASSIACLLALGALFGPLLMPTSERPADQDPDIDPASRQLRDQSIVVDVTSSQGVQINTDGMNTQNNNFFGSP